MIGRKFGSYVVASRTINKKDVGRKYYSLKCEDCKREYIRSTRDLNRNNLKECCCKRYVFIENSNSYSFFVKGNVVYVPKDDSLIKTIQEYSWRLDKDGYVISSKRIDGKIVKISLHRLIIGYYYGEKDLSVDHKDRDKLNNTLANLRYANGVEQQLNRDTPKNNTSGIKGVHFDNKTNKWMARIQVNGKRISESFDNFEDAVSQRKEWDSVITLDKRNVL